MRLLCVLAAVVAETYLCTHWLRLNVTTVGFLFLVTVLLIATAWGLAEALAGSVVATLCYNYFFFPPVGTFTIDDPMNWVALMAFLITSVTASQLSELARRRNREVLSRQLDMERLYALSRAVLLADPTEPMAKQVAREIARIYDLPAVALYDGANHETFRAGPEDLPEIEAALSEAAVSGTLLRDERRQVVVTPVSFGGRPVGSLALRGSAFTDTALQSLCGLVSLGMEKAQSQAAASRAEAARQSEEFKSTLLDAIAHEFKTPLTSIKAGTTAILSSTITKPDQQREALAIVDAAADRLGTLVTDAIHLSRIEASQMRLNLQSRSLRAVVHETLRHMKSATDGREVELSLPDDLPSVLVDPELIQLVFRHLIDNALKYSPVGSPIAVGARSDGGFVALSIRNQGEGIPEWERSRIFDKFYRGAAARRVPGTGMGLAIAREVIVAHGGELRVESAPGEGAEFTLSLSAAKGEPAP